MEASKGLPFRMILRAQVIEITVIAKTCLASTATVVAEYLNAFSPCRLNSSVPLAVSQPRPPPEIGLMIKGEALSLLNILCMRHRWPDPVYTRVWKGGASHVLLFRCMVQTAVCKGEFMGGQIFEIDVEGEMERNVNGAKDSAAARLLSWFGEQGIPVSSVPIQDWSGLGNCKAGQVIKNNR